MLERAEPFAARLRVLASTPPTPGLPLITARFADSRDIRSAVSGAIKGLAQADREALLLRGVVDIPAAAYLAVPTPRPPGRSGRPT
jgi:hypothetical protein